MLRNAAIFLDDGPWRIAACDTDGPTVSVPHDGETDVSQRVDQLDNALRKMGFDHNAGGLILALPTAWCASATVHAADLPRRDRRTAMTYRLEEKLPYAAEHFTAEFIADNGDALGVCVLTGKLTPITTALIERGYRINIIAPTALLLAQACVGDADSQPISIVLWRHDGWCDAVAFSASGVPVSWVSLANDDRSITLHLDVLELRGERGPGDVCICDDEAGRPAPRAALPPGLSVDHTQDGPYTTAARFAGCLVSGKVNPWIDYNRDGYGDGTKIRLLLRPVRAAMVACVLMLICLNAAFLLRVHQYDAMSRGYRQQESSLYTELYPGQTPPIAIHTRLAGELKLISGMRGRSDAMPPRPATFTLLHSVLVSLPDDIRHRVLELRIEDDSAYIDGQARTHGDVSKIAKALTRGGLQVETRHTEQLANEQGVGFVMVAYDGATRREARTR